MADRFGAQLGRRLSIRLVQGAYWDTEIKRAQERGLPDYPVFTRKAMTDLCYMACARKLLAARPRIYPQIATHNALTVASVIEEAGGVEGYEFQRLHGMGERFTWGCSRRRRRRSAASTLRWAVIAISSPIWCGGSWKTARTPPSVARRRSGSSDREDHRAPAGDPAIAGVRPASQNPAAARHLQRPAQFDRRRIRPRGKPRSVARRHPLAGAGSRAACRWDRASGALAAHSLADRPRAVGSAVEGDEAIVISAMAAA